MRHLNRLILFFSLSFFLPVGICASEISSQSSGVFKFQQKLATKGNARAQYKLATMYESGTGIKQDLEQAKHWYNKALGAGIKAAVDRMTYLSVKQHGYDKTKNSAWLEGVKKDASESKGDAMFLLAQLYREGIGVKKDLNQSLLILDKVSLLGAADVENEMALIQKEIDADKRAKANIRKKQKLELARLAQQKKAQQIEQQANIEQQKIQKKELLKEPQADPAQQSAQQLDTEQAIQAEKIRRYEKAMMQLKREQQQINEQQTWAAGGDAEMVDDEI